MLNPSDRQREAKSNSKLNIKCDLNIYDGMGNTIVCKDEV